MKDWCEKHRNCKYFFQTAYLRYIDSFICELDEEEYFGEEVSEKCKNGLKPFRYGRIFIDDFVPEKYKAKIYKFPKNENS